MIIQINNLLKKKNTPILRHKTLLKHIIIKNKKIYFFIYKKIILKYIKKRVACIKGIKVLNRGEFDKNIRFHLFKLVYNFYYSYYIVFLLKKRLKHLIIIKNYSNVLCFQKIQFSLIGELIFLNFFKFSKIINIFYKNFLFILFLNKIILLRYNYIPLWFCKTGFHINNISFITSNMKIFIAKAAGTSAKIYSFSKKNIFLTLELPSKELNLVSTAYLCYIGKNSGNCAKILGKCSTKLQYSYKSQVRGIAKNPVDHPHGGRSNINKPEVSPWFWVTKYKH